MKLLSSRPSSRALVAVTAATTLLASVPLSCGAAPVDDLRAAVTAGGSAAVKDAKPKAFSTALSAVLAGVPAGQVPAYAAAAAGLRPDLAEPIVHAAISALHLPGQLPDQALVAATVKAVIAAAPDSAALVVARSVADAPEARDAIVQAATAAAPTRGTLFAKINVTPALSENSGLGSLPSSQVRLADAPNSLAASPAQAAPSGAAVTNGTLNPANVATPRVRNPPVSGF